MNEVAKNNEASLIVSNPLEHELPRRNFLKTTMATPVLRSAGVQALSELAENRTVVISQTVQLMPNFLSSLTILRMRQLFGDNAEALIGMPLAEAMPEMLDYKARQRFPNWMIDWAIKRGDAMLAIKLFGSMQIREMGTMPDAKNNSAALLGSRDQEHKQKVARWFDAIIEKIAAEPQTVSMVDSCLGECIALEIHERVLPSLSDDIQRLLQRKNLARIQSGKRPIELQYTAQIGADAVLETLCAEEASTQEDEYKTMTQRYCSEEAMQQQVRELIKNPVLRRRFLECVGLDLDDCMEALEISQERLRTIEEAGVKAEKEELRQKSLQEKILPKQINARGALSISETLQHPFQRVMAQISMLADSKYVRTWEQPVPEQSHE